VGGSCDRRSSIAGSRFAGEISITLISTKNMLTSLTAKQFRIACVKQDKETEINEAKDGDGNNTKAKLPT
jgi:hypothetical protein